MVPQPRNRPLWGMRELRRGEERRGEESEAGGERRWSAGEREEEIGNGKLSMLRGFLTVCGQVSSGRGWDRRSKGCTDDDAAFSAFFKSQWEDFVGFCA